MLRGGRSPIEPMVVAVIVMPMAVVMAVVVMVVVVVHGSTLKIRPSALSVSKYR